MRPRWSATSGWSGPSMCSRRSSARSKLVSASSVRLSFSHASPRRFSDSTMAWTSASSYPAVSAASHSAAVWACSCPACSRSPCASRSAAICPTVSAHTGVSLPCRRCSAVSALRKDSSASWCSPWALNALPCRVIRGTRCDSTALPSYLSSTTFTTFAQSMYFSAHSRNLDISATAASWSRGVSPGAGGSSSCASKSFTSSLHVRPGFALTRAAQRACRSDCVSRVNRYCSSFGSVTTARTHSQSPACIRLHSTSSTTRSVGSRPSCRKSARWRCAARRSFAVGMYRRLMAASRGGKFMHRTSGGAPGSLPSGHAYRSNLATRACHVDGCSWSSPSTDLTSSVSIFELTPALEHTIVRSASPGSAEPNVPSILSRNMPMRPLMLPGNSAACAMMLLASFVSLALCLISSHAATRYAGLPASSLLSIAPSCAGLKAPPPNMASTFVTMPERSSIVRSSSGSSARAASPRRMSSDRSRHRPVVMMHRTASGRLLGSQSRPTSPDSILSRPSMTSTTLPKRLACARNLGNAAHSSPVASGTSMYMLNRALSSRQRRVSMWRTSEL
mmetsp:Transcript_15458/g.52786  ORF Transcript_15458/g.52786 Transcript_15458/m.52786 type:complete len:563 (-) Transcript_15458:425-2113(-)